MVLQELDEISLVIIYIIIGIMITLLTYDMSIEYNTNYMKENSWRFSNLSEYEVNNLIQFSPLLMIVCWAPFMVYFIVELFFMYIRQLYNMFR